MDISYLPTDLTSTIVFKTVYLVFTKFFYGPGKGMLYLTEKFGPMLPTHEKSTTQQLVGQWGWG